MEREEEEPDFWLDEELDWSERREREESEYERLRLAARGRRELSE